MSYRIRPYETGDHERVLEICIAAFTPIHALFEQTLGRGVFERQYRDWQRDYARTFENITTDDPANRVHVVEDSDEIVAFVFTHLDPEKKTGEIGLNAVDPARQSQGIGKAMYRFALEDLKSRGAEVAYVGTGGDAAHAPARAAYDAVGFDKAIPSLHLFREL